MVLGQHGGKLQGLILAVGNVSIRQNFESHSAALKQAGATDAELRRLRDAMLAVERAEKGAGAKSIDPALVMQPCTIEALGWVIAPPTKEARAWAQKAVMAVTGGHEPSPGIGQLLALVAGLWALREAGERRFDGIMRAVSGANVLAGIVSAEADRLQESGSVDARTVQQLAEDYARLMGFQMPPRLAGALLKYLDTLEAIHGRMRTSAIASFAKASPPLSSSASAGRNTGPDSRQPSSTRRSARRSASGRRVSRR